MKETGVFLEFELNHGLEFHRGGIALNSGRNCLRYLIRAKKIKKIWLPKLLCSAISNTCKEEKVLVSYYSVNNYLRPILSEIRKQDDWVYLINFYGQYSRDEIISYAKQFNNLIVDNVQSFYTKPIEKLDTIYSCRKFFGVPDGAYLYTDSILSENLEKDSSYGRLTFLAGRLERSANEFYSQYQKNEQLFDKLPLRRMSLVTNNLLQGIDYEQIKDKREQNFNFLHKNLKTINQLKLRQSEGPYMYPLMIKDGELIRKDLQKKKIYIPTLWPNVKKTLNEYSLAKNILPLPCDQRYDLEDMHYLIMELNKCLS